MLYLHPLFLANWFIWLKKICACAIICVLTTTLRKVEILVSKWILFNMFKQGKVQKKEFVFWNKNLKNRPVVFFCGAWDKTCSMNLLTSLQISSRTSKEFTFYCVFMQRHCFPGTSIEYLKYFQVSIFRRLMASARSPSTILTTLNDLPVPLANTLEF